MSLKLISSYRTKTVMALASMGLVVGSSLGAAYLGAGMVQDAINRKQSIRLMQLSAAGMAVAVDPTTLSMNASSAQVDDPALAAQINEAAMALAIRYAPDDYGQLNTALAQNIAQTRISNDLRVARSLKSQLFARDNEDAKQPLMIKINNGPVDLATNKKGIDGLDIKPLASTLQTAPPLVMKNRSSSDLDCLSTALYYEARGEGDSGMRAVAQVILNRVRHPAYPKTVCGVVYQGSHLRTGCQFSFTCNGAMRRGPSGWIWQKSKAIAEDALSGHVYRNVGTSTHFHTKHVNPVWAGRLNRVAVVGTHIFYQFPGRGARISNGNSIRPSDQPAQASAQDAVMNELQIEAPTPSMDKDSDPIIAVLREIPLKTADEAPVKLSAQSEHPGIEIDNSNPQP